MGRSDVDWFIDGSNPPRGEILGRLIGKAPSLKCSRLAKSSGGVFHGYFSEGDEAAWFESRPADIDGG